MKKIAFLGLVMIAIGVFFMKEENIRTIINTYILQNNKNVEIGEVNKYYREYDFNFVQNTKSFNPKSYQDILNIYYTVLNAGKDSFSFYCDSEYDACLSDIEDLANNQDLLSDINNYVHPYNSFLHIETVYDTLGKVTINVQKNYSDEDVNVINSKVDELANNLIIEGDTNYNNIKRIHDYIINNTKYDSARSDYGDETYKSNTAYGALFQGYAVCGGYTDLMQLFLERLNIKSYRVSSAEHVWNAVLLDNQWLNLDLTWDDPVSDDGKDYLDYDYFLINTEKLLDIEKTEHNFNMNNYTELKTN